MAQETGNAGIAAELEGLAGRADVTAAVDYVRSQDEATLATQIELSEIPAPPFEEGERAARLAELLRSAGLEEIHVDETGNVVGERVGAREGQHLVVSAHLDTIFPRATDVSVRREDDLLRGAGISDDARGLATLVALVRALEAGGLRTEMPLRFVGTVGEEGAGDLRGVKALFADSGAGHGALGFISLDGAGVERIVARGLGSRRFRISIRGPGGHSWVDWGTPNPAHALAELGSRLASLVLPESPRTSLTIARLGGGKSINAIPQVAWMELDLRSADEPTLGSLVERLHATVDEARATHEGLSYAVEVIGSRPGGATPRDARLVGAAAASTRHLGYSPTLALSSTDANVPMALGVPAITVGCGGEAGKAHTTEEWYRNTDGPDGIVRALYVVLLMAGLADGSA